MDCPGLRRVQVRPEMKKYRNISSWMHLNITKALKWKIRPGLLAGQFKKGKETENLWA
jgi:hypothetical protein